MIAFAAALFVLQAETPWEQISAKLLKDHPNDSAVLMLCLDRKDLDGHRRLAKIDPSPMVLSHVVNALLIQESDPAVRNEILALTTTWAQQDPGNGYPKLILASLKAGDGDLAGALALLEDAARGKWFRSYAAESRAAIVRMLQERKITDIMAIWHAAAQWRGSFDGVIFCGVRVLTGCGEEEEYRRRPAEAERWLAARLEIARRIHEDKGADSVLATHIALGPAAEAMYRTALSRRRPEEAARYAELSRTAFRYRQSMTRAVQAWNKNDPIGKAMIDADLDPLQMGIAIMLKPERMKEFARKTERVVREKEALFRPILEKGLTLSEPQRILQALPEEDRKSIAAMKPPIDHAVSVQDAFFPEKYGPGHRARLAELAKLRIEDNYEASDLIRELAVQAIRHHGDKEAAAALDELVRASLGDSAPDVLKFLADNLKDGFPDYCRAVALLGRKEHVGALLELLREGMKGRWFEQAIAAAYALRDLTGKDYGLDVAKWDAFAKEQPALFKK